jgi:hypothetical protein
MDQSPPLSTPAEELQKQITALRDELELVKRREAAFRVHMVKEFLDRGERNTYVHSLHEQRDALIRREQEASADLETLTQKLEAEIDRSLELRSELAQIKRSFGWRLASLFRGPARPAPGEPSPRQIRPGDNLAATGALFSYYLHTSPFRVYREPAFTLKGWAWPDDGKAVTGIRVNLGGRITEGTVGLAEPEVIARYGPQANNPRPGFSVTFDTPEGRHFMSLEAQLSDGAWHRIMGTMVWSEPSPA